MYDRYKIRNLNERVVLKALVNHQPVSRASLSKLTRLNKATMTEIVATLMERGLVIETGLGESNISGGRKPIILELNHQAGYVISIDLGNHYIDSILSNLSGEVIDSYRISSIQVNSENIISLIDLCYRRYLPLVSETNFGIVAMVLAVHGVVHKNHITLSPNYNMMGLHLYDKLEKIYDFPIILENEANLAAIAHLKANQTVSNLIVLSVHTGIGGGVIINRELYHGTYGGAGELGHITLYPNGRPCQCGKKGCFEQYCSTQALLEDASEILHTQVTLNDFKTALVLNNPEIQQLTATYLKNFAISIGTFLSSFDPDMIYIISDVLEEIPELMMQLSQEVETYCQRSIPLEISSLNYGATLIGASIEGISHFLDIDLKVEQ